MKLRTRPKRASVSSTSDLYTLMDFIRTNPVSVVSSEVACKSARVYARNQSEGKLNDLANIHMTNRKIFRDKAKTSRV